ncbi:MAG: VWA domain-containing protein [Candidatus Omnitrophota bacterium]|nr:VWA domain-containing protein [Candidatus Omnitrophota bacterium]
MVFQALEAAARQGSQPAVKTLQETLFTSKDSEVISRSMMALGEAAGQGNSSAIEAVWELYHQRGTIDCLGEQTGLTKRVRIAVLDDFEIVKLEGDEFIHGNEVTELIQSVLAGEPNVIIDKVRNRPNANFSLERWADSIPQNSGEAILVNMSLGSNPDGVSTILEPEPENAFSTVNAILDLDLIKRLGRRGVVFVVSAGNDGCLRRYTHRVPDNVLIVGGAEKKEGRWQRWKNSNWGPDLFALSLCSNGGNGNGTSYSAPIVTPLLALILLRNPKMSMKEAIDFLRKSAKPIADDPLYKSGFLGAGVITPWPISKSSATSVLKLFKRDTLPIGFKDVPASDEGTSLNDDTLRSHRFARIINGQDFWKVFEEELRKVGITNEKEIKQILEGGIYWINKATGKIGKQKGQVIQAAASALSRVYSRNITPDEVLQVSGANYHEAIHGQLNKDDIVRIRDQLKKILTPAEYVTLLQNFQNQYGPYPDELELIEELIAQYKTETIALHNENLLLLDNDGLIIPLDRRAAGFISQNIILKDSFSEDLLHSVKGYYAAKRKLLEACRMFDLETEALIKDADSQAYEEALEEIKTLALRVKQLAGQGESLAEAVESLRYADEYKEGEIAEWNEMLYAAGQEFSDSHKKIIRDLASEWAKLAAKEEHQDELRQKIVNSVEEVSAERLLSSRLTGMQNFIVAELLHTLGRLETREHSQTSMPKIKESIIFMLPFTDLNLFRAVLSHEIFHYLCREGHIPLAHYSEVIPQAISAQEMFKQGGKEALERLYGELNSRIFAAGQRLAEEEKSLRNVNILLDTALSIVAEFYEKRGWVDEKGLVKISNDQAQRFVGVALAGWAERIAQDTGKEFKLILLDFAKDVLAQPRGQAPLTREDIKYILGLVREIEDLARVLSRNYLLKMAPWRKIWISDQPTWRIVKDVNEFQFVPEDLAYLKPEAVKGLAMEELLRLLYFNPVVIEKDLLENGLFLSLLQVMQTPRGINRGLMKYPGIANWLNVLYQEQYGKASLLMSRIQAAQMPYYLQFMEGALYEARMNKKDERFSEKEVTEALDNTREAREKAIQAQADADFYAILKTEIWPVLQKLYQLSQEAAASQKIFEEMVKNNKAPLSGAQQQMAASGAIPKIDALRETQQEIVKQMIKDALEKMSPQEKEALIKGIQQALAQAEEEFIRQRMGEGTLPQITQSPQAQKTPSQDKRTMEELQQLIQQAQDTGDEIGDKIDQLLKLISQAKESQEGLTQKAGQIRQGAADKQPTQKDAQQLENQAQDIKDKTSQLPAPAGSLSDLSKKIKDKTGQLSQEQEGAASANAASQELAGKSEDIKQRVSQLQQRAEDLKNKVERLVKQIRTRPDNVDPVKEQARGVQDAGKDFGKDLKDLKATTEECNSITSGLMEQLKQLEQALNKGEVAPLQPGGFTRPEPDAKPEAAGVIPEPAPLKPQSEPAPSQPISPEAQAYLEELEERTPADWRAIEGKADKLRKEAMLEANGITVQEFDLFQYYYQQVAGLINVMKKNLQQALQKNLRRKELTELTTGDDIDEDSLPLVKATKRIFKIEAQPDKFRWRVSLIIDVSGSMKGEKIEAAINTALLFSEALNKIKGVEFEIVAFEDKEYIPLKKYEDKWNLKQACYTINKIKEVCSLGHGTNDVGAVSSAIKRIRQNAKSGTNKMIFVVTDGGSGVGGQKEMIKVMDKNRDIRIFGWGVGPDMEEVEETYKPYGNWVEKVEELPRRVGEVLRQQLGRPVIINAITTGVISIITAIISAASLSQAYF